MKILFISNMYPTKSNPVFGVFVKEQIDSITGMLDCEYDLYFINGREKGHWQYLKSIFGIPLKILKGKYDVIHIHYGLAALFLLFYKPTAKVFLTLHGADILVEQGKKWQIFITKKASHKVTKVFILNDQMEKIMRSLNVNYEIVPCGVNIDFFKRNYTIYKSEKSKLILFPGDPELKVKNFTLFEKVISLLNQTSFYTVEFKCINNLSRKQVRDLMNIADCILMTSESEGSPQVIKEALSCGLPAISVPVGDVNLITCDVPNCYVSKTFDPEELCKLVSLSFQYSKEGIREAFVNKNIYDHNSVATRIIENYIA
jgi:glycosyltransferase involved in cell wall biosynthesis